MEKPKSITINDIQYYNASELEKFDPVYFYGCKNTVRQIVKNKKIKSKDIAYANDNKRYGWRLSKNQNKPPPKANLLLKEEWVLNNVPGMKDVGNVDDEVEKKVIKKKQNKTENKKAPPLLELDEDEKFKNDNGDTFDIETRGVRSPNGIYFLAKDVSRVFEMKSLSKNLKDIKGAYRKNNDYLFFILNSDKFRCKKQLFITYEGMIKILYSSHSDKAKSFRNWATETLFTVQMGSNEEKEDLASGLIGIPAQTLRNVLSKSAGKISCVYRFVLGNCKDLRKKMNISKDIPDDYLIIKYGFTDNLVRRTNEHIKTYNSIEGVKLELMNFAYIDPEYISDAETEVKEFFEDVETFIKYKEYKELVAINPKHNRQIKKLYKSLKDEYGGCVKDLNDKIGELSKEVKDKNLEIVNLIKIHKLELMNNNKENELMLKEKELMLKDKENENNILGKDLEIAQLKLQMMTSK
jgi:hypothetical protein